MPAKAPQELELLRSFELRIRDTDQQDSADTDRQDATLPPCEAGVSSFHTAPSVVGATTRNAYFSGMPWFPTSVPGQPCCVPSKVCLLPLATVPWGYYSKMTDDCSLPSINLSLLSRFEIEFLSFGETYHLTDFIGRCVRKIGKFYRINVLPASFLIWRHFEAP